MPSPKYTKLEITPEAYLALESETILQGKTLKKLASELILKGVSNESIDFAQRALKSGDNNFKFKSGNLSKVIKDVGVSGVRIDENILDATQKKLREDGYLETMLYVAQHMASIQRDELHRVLTICEYHKLSAIMAADVVKNLNKLESGLIL